MAAAEASAVCPTAFWTAHCRALDGDAWAERLCGPEGMAIGRALEARVSVRAAVGVRTRIFDRLISEAVERDGVETIVSLGCGLDGRALRGCGAARWIEVDAPALIAWKKERVGATRVDVEAPTWIAADLGCVKSMEEVMAGAAGRTLVVAEGVLQYLEPERVTALLGLVARRRGETKLVVDVGGGAWSRVFGPVSRVTRSIGMPYRTRVSNVDRFFARAGWRIAETECISHSFSRPLSAFLVPGWSAAARVIEAARLEASLNEATPP